MARAPKARRRRSRRTPRRWLPFLALSALVGGALLVEPDPPMVDPLAVDPSLDIATMPSVSYADAISSAFYCSGASASGEGGIAELTVVLANDAEAGATGTVTFVGAEGVLDAVPVDVPAHGRARIIAHDVVEADWVGAIVDVQGGRVAVDREVVGPTGFDAGPCSSTASGRWYVPSGSTQRGAELYLSLFNPFPDAASVDITFATETGPRTPRATRSLSVPGRSVRVVRVGEDVTDRAEVASIVSARSGRVVVDRVQTYDGSGDEVVSEGEDGFATPPPRGLISGAASSVRSSRWVIGGGRVDAGVRTQVALYNPSSDVAEVDLVVTPRDPEANVEIEPVELSIRAKEQALVDLSELPDLPLGLDVWIDVRSIDGVPVVAERLSFYGEPSGREAATATPGSPLASSTWMVTQAGATRARTTSVLITNPGPTSAGVTVFQLADGTRTEVPSAATDVPPGDRRSLVLDDVAPAATLVIATTEPVVVTSSLSPDGGQGLAIAADFPYPESAVVLPPPS